MIKNSKIIAYFLILFFFQFCFSQKKDKKETVYLLFNTHSTEKCTVPVEGKGYVNKSKYRKEYQGEYVFFKICDEIFTAHKTKSFKDTCSIKALENIKLVNIKYLKDKYNSSYYFKHHVFKKIYFIEKLPNNKIIKYEVGWNDEIMMIDD